MENVIRLFDSSSVPFGKLSNNAYFPMTIDEQKYPTVTNYIYSNMVSSNIMHYRLQNMEIKGTKKMNEELMNAIDFLIKKQGGGIGDKTPKIHSQRDDLISALSKITNQDPDIFEDWKTQSMQNTYRVYKILKSREIPQKKIEKYVKNAWKEYEKTKDPSSFSKYLSSKITEKSTSPIDLQKDWDAYENTGIPKKQQQDEDKKEKYMLLIQNEVRQPFESINLENLKQKLLSDSQVAQMGIYQVYTQAITSELRNLIRNALEKAFTVKFSPPDYAELLIVTGNAPIHFLSDDPFLGLGKDGKGENLVGKVLLQLRHNIIEEKRIAGRKKESENEEEKIYNTYIAYVALKDEISNKNDNLLEYLGLTPIQIVNKYGKERLLRGVPTKSTVMELYGYDKLPPTVMIEIHQPGTLVINVRKQNLRFLQTRLNVIKDNIIFDSYLGYIIKRKYEDELDRQIESMRNTSKSSVEEITRKIISDTISIEKAKLDQEKLIKLKARIIDLFNLGMLSSSLSDRIENDINKLYIPTDADVDEAEIAEIAVPPSFEGKGKSKGKSPEESSKSSSNSDEDSDIIKKVFKGMDKTKRKDLINLLVSIRGGKFSDYRDWSTEELEQRAEAIQEEDVVKDPTTGSMIKPTIIGGIYIEPQGPPIIVHKDPDTNAHPIYPFAPEAFTGMMTIDDKLYPTIQHYIITRLIATTGIKQVVDKQGVIKIEKGIGISEAYKKMIVIPDKLSVPESYVSFEKGGRIYDQEQKDSNILLLSTLTNISLTKKFEDKSLQDLLLLTGDKEIQWVDPNNLYLGIGTRNDPGVNYIGKTMIAIRQTIIEKRSEQEEIEIDEADIVSFMTNDSFIFDWISMRVKDMCGVTYRLQQYLKIKEGIDINLDQDIDLQKMVRLVIDKIYQPCGALISSSEKIKIHVPEFFIDIVKKCKGMGTGIQPVKVKGSSGQLAYSKEIHAYREAVLKDIQDTTNEFWGDDRISRTVTEAKEFDNMQREKWSDFLSELKDLSQKEKNKRIDEFREKQATEYNEFWGIKKYKKTKEEILSLDHKIKNMRQALTSYIKDKERLEKHYQNIIVDVSQIYWDRIIVMLNTLAQHVQPLTASNIRTFLVQMGELNSVKISCIKIIKNEDDNCIVSALLNLLNGIHEFKEEFSPTLTMDEDDVKLAGSIILNSKLDIDIEHVNIGNEIEFPDRMAKEDENDEENKEEKEDDDNYVPEEGAFPDDEDGDGEEENQYFGFGAKFGFKWRSEKNSPPVDGNEARIEQYVLNISKDITVSVAKNITTAIIKMMQTIKDDSLPLKIKQNRINFFSTIR